MIIFREKRKRIQQKHLKQFSGGGIFPAPVFHCSLQSHLFQRSPAQEKTPLNTGDTGRVKDGAHCLVSTQCRMPFQFLSGLALWELLPKYLQAKDTAICRGRWTVDSFWLFCSPAERGAAGRRGDTQWDTERRWPHPWWVVSGALQISWTTPSLRSK